MTQEQNTNGGKNDKRTKNNPSPSHIYAESNAVAIKAIYYGINIKQGRKGNVNILPLIKPL